MALTTTSAPTVKPDGVTALAEPRPPFRSRWSRRSRRRRCRGRSRARRRAAACVAELAIGRIAAPVLVAAVEQVEQDRLRHDRHAHARRPGSRRPARAARPARRAAASRPKAEPPESTIASTPLDRHCRARGASVSRVPGAPPSTAHDGDRGLVEQRDRDAGGEARRRAALPTRRPGTSVMRLRMGRSS